MPLYIGYDESKRQAQLPRLEQPEKIDAPEEPATVSTASKDGMAGATTKKRAKNVLFYIAILIFPVLVSMVYRNTTKIRASRKCQVQFRNLIPKENAPTGSAFPGSLEVPQLSSSPADLSEIFLAEFPAIIHNFKGTRGWPARNWTFEKFSNKMPTLRAHLSKDRTVRMHSQVQPFGQLDALVWNRPWEEAEINSSDFLENQTGWHYLYLDFNELPPAIAQDIGNIQDLGSTFRQVIEAALWAGTRGISSPLHYDAAHNVYHQLVGFKRFLLFPPNRSMNVFPRIHPSTRSSQIDLLRVPWMQEGCDITSTPAAAAKEFWRMFNSHELHAYETVLGPGDILYIPPYWWHRASVPADADSPSVSLAAYTQSSIMRAYDIFKHHALPFDPDWPHNQKVAALKEYVLALASLSLKGSKCTPQISRCGASLIQHLLRDRYFPVRFDPAVEGWTQMVQKGQESFQNLTSPLQLPAHVRKAMHARAENLRGRILQSHNVFGGISYEQFESEVLSLIEDVVAAMLGANSTEAFLRWILNEL